MIVETKVFELCYSKYDNLSELAEAMGLSVSQVYRVRDGKRSINQKFIIGAKRAFPELRLDELFYFDNVAVDNREDEVIKRHNRMVREYVEQEK